ncbi:hypothetical protein [Anaerosporobacter sp.]|uniref:hypothetical protein n=1 Tax=Anaerosporobacter sp. TaxID=1872529 RepID=UPI00286F2CA7|nr:hypothetical protein [Anaerosporobacter sp.]
MEQSEKTAINIHITEFIQGLKNLERYPNEVLALVQEDLEYGLSEEQVKQYYKKKWSIGQMKIYSKCLRNGYSEEAIKVITSEHLSRNQMSIALEFYEKGVPLDSIKAVVGQNEFPAAMKKAYEMVLEQMKETRMVAEDAPDYVKKLVDQISAMITHIEFQEKRYDALAEHLKIFESTKKDEDVRDDLVKQNAHQATVMNEQQNQIMQANSAIARYRTELEQKEKEMKKMQDKTEALEEQIRIMDQRDSDSKAVSKTASTVQPERVLVPEPSIELKQSTIIPQNISGYGVPIYYTVSMVDSYGRVVQTLPIERTEKKTSGITNLFSKLGIKKKSRQDIVKLVASGDLVPDQLMQLKSAIERGLTESQLVELINNNVSAEKMKEIIEIAVLENAMYEKE